MSQPINEFSACNRLRLYLVRHGEIEQGVNSVYYGQLDVALSACGIEQSNRLCEILAPVPLVAVYSSDLTRTLHTADLIARSHGLGVTRLPAIREINMGEWEGQGLAEINTAHPEIVARMYHNPREFQYPGGESFTEFELRVNNAVQSILASYQTGGVVLVTHGGVCRLVIAGVLELPPKNRLRIAQDFGCLNIIDWYNGGPIVRRLNHTPAERL
jgi:alpha-ribazole phosphatase